MEASLTVVDLIAAALDAHSLVMVSAVIKAAEDHLAAHGTEEAAIDYLTCSRPSR